MRKSRPVAAKQPIEGKTVFIADFMSGIDGERPSSRLVLVISVLFQIHSPREFRLIETKRLASVPEAGCDMSSCPNLRTPHLSPFCLIQVHCIRRKDHEW